MDTKKLRQKILDLAIRGKLVPQDPNDEPASVLLERIRAEKERLIKEGKIKRSKKSASDDEIEAPFEIPESWEWTTIGEIASSILYGVSESAKESGNYKLLRITDIQNNKVNWESVPFTNYDENKAQPYLLQDGDILFARTGATVGKSYLVEGLLQPSIYASYLIRVQTSSVILPSYIKFFFESGYYWEQISLSSVGIGQPNVNGTTLAALSIPIPPYQEQKHIVNEVERWFTLIDELESNEGDLLKTIDKAKSKILDLAIHGKLVPQDPNDEPASVLLQKIREEKQQLVKAGKLKKKDLIETPISDDEIPFAIPDTWEWVRMQNVMEFINGRAYKKDEFLEKGKYKVLRVGNLFTNDSWYYSNLELDEDKYCYNGDLLYAWSASFGPHIWEGEKTIFHYHIWNVKYNQCVLYREYLYYFFLIDKMKIKGSTTGSTMVHVSMENMKPRLIPLPPLAEQKRIVAKIEQLLGEIDKLKK